MEAPYRNPYIGTTVYSRQDIARYCRLLGGELATLGMHDHRGQPLDPVRLMWATAGRESSFGHDCAPRFEPAYYAGGRYAANPPMPELIRLYGKAAACSYGPWQVMFCNSCHRVPVDLDQLENCAVDFVHHANDILKVQRPPSLAEFAWAYNAGNWHSAVEPADYVAHVIICYDVPMPAEPAPDEGTVNA